MSSAAIAPTPASTPVNTGSSSRRQLSEKEGEAFVDACFEGDAAKVGEVIREYGWLTPFDESWVMRGVVALCDGIATGVPEVGDHDAVERELLVYTDTQGSIFGEAVREMVKALKWWDQRRAEM